MSERHRWAVVTLLASTIPAIGAAQDTSALAQHLHQLDLLRHTAAVALARAESAGRERLDTVHSGALVIVVRPADAGLVRQASGVAWTRLDSLYGDEAATLADVVFQLVRAGSAVIRNKADTLLSNWAGPLLLSEVPSAAEHARVYVELVTAPS